MKQVIDIDAVRRVAEAPPAHPEILGDGILVSRAFLKQVIAELSAARDPKRLARIL